jgi:hypothetical protein
MADLAEVLSTYQALAGVAVGAGLTYWFGALNRRRQEAREDKTRWYETRLKACAELAQPVSNLTWLTRPSTTSYAEKKEAGGKAASELGRAVGIIHLVGSLEVVDKAERLLRVANEGMSNAFSGRRVDTKLWDKSLEEFGTAARRTLATRALEPPIERPGPVWRTSSHNS